MVHTMPNLKGRVSFSWIYVFAFSSSMLLYVQSARSPTLRTEAQTQTTASLPFGARILTSPKKYLHDTKNISSVPGNEDTNGKIPLILNKGLQLTDVHMERNSSGGSAIRKANRILKKIKSKRRRIRPTSNNRALPELSNRKNFSIIEKNNSVVHSSDMKNIGRFQKERENRTFSENNSFGVSGNTGNRNKDFLPKRQPNSVPRDVVGSSEIGVSVDTTTRNKDVIHEMNRNKVASVNISRVINRSDAVILNKDLPEVKGNPFGLSGRNRVTAPTDSTSWRRDLLPERLRIATRSYDRNRATVPSNSMSWKKDIHPERLRNSTEYNERKIVTAPMSWYQGTHSEKPRNKIEANDRSRSIVPTDNISLKKDILPGTENRTGSHERNRATVPNNNISWNKNFKSDKQQNRIGLVEISNVTVANGIITKNNWKDRNFVRPLEKSLVTVTDFTTVTHTKEFLTEKHRNLAEPRNRKNTALLEDVMNNTGKLIKIKKDHSPFNFPHSRGKFEDKSNLDVNPTKRKLPCPCHWSKEQCGCECTGSLNYDDFQALAGYFQPCQNFSFSLKDGSYFSLPPNLFSRASPIRNIHLKISNSTFDYLFDPTPDTSPFRGLILEQKGTLEFFNITTRQGWNWGSLKDLKASSSSRQGWDSGSLKDLRTSAGIDVVFEGCGMKRLSSDFAMVAGGNVEELTVSGSGLEMVGSGAFASFGGLARFRLPRNRLRSIKRTDLPPEPLELVEIDLSGNQLQNLDHDFFSEMPSLKTLLLSGNPMRTLGQGTLATVIGRTHVYGLGELPLQCDCHLRWLKNSTLDPSPVFRENLKGATCRRPPHLRGTPFKDLAMEHLTC